MHKSVTCSLYYLPFQYPVFLISANGNKRGKGSVFILAVNGIPYHSYGVSLAIWDHTVLPASLLVSGGRVSGGSVRWQPAT